MCSAPTRGQLRLLRTSPTTNHTVGARLWATKVFFFCHVTLVTIWSFSKPHPRRVFRASMQHVDELTGESKCAYFQWKESDENATFQSKETQDHKTLPAVHSIQKDCRPEQWRCRRRAMLSNGLSSGCTNNVPTYAKICADDTDDSRH